MTVHWQFTTTDHNVGLAPAMISLLSAAPFYQQLGYFISVFYDLFCIQVCRKQ